MPRCTIWAKSTVDSQFYWYNLNIVLQICRLSSWRQWLLTKKRLLSEQAQNMYNNVSAQLVWYFWNLIFATLAVQQYYPIWVQSGIVGHVENHLVIQCLLTLLDGMCQAGKTIRLECILTGAGPQGAQELAFHGSTFPKEEDWDWKTFIAGYEQVFAFTRHIGESSKRAKVRWLSLLLWYIYVILLDCHFVWCIKGEHVQFDFQILSQCKGSF